MVYNFLNGKGSKVQETEYFPLELDKFISEKAPKKKEIDLKVFAKRLRHMFNVKGEEENE